MLREEMKIGPKGQVVIPKSFRKILGISPGSNVIFEIKDNKVFIETPSKDTETIFEIIAKKGISFSPESYKDSRREVEEEWMKLKEK